MRSNYETTVPLLQTCLAETSKTQADACTSRGFIIPLRPLRKISSTDLTIALIQRNLSQRQHHRVADKLVYPSSSAELKAFQWLVQKHSF
jgi:predicted butyrate kinase (DUF1464 family)